MTTGHTQDWLPLRAAELVRETDRAYQLTVECYTDDQPSFTTTIWAPKSAAQHDGDHWCLRGWLVQAKEEEIAAAGVGGCVGLRLAEDPNQGELPL
jgi:hypothetical protein